MSVEEILAAIAKLSEGERRKVYAALDAKRRSDPIAPPPTRPSAHDLAKHLIGSGSGLHDVSSNKAYMKGFGESSLP